MQRELAASGLSPEEILAKTLLLQKAMAGDNSPAFINKTLKNALNVANLNNADLTKVFFVKLSVPNIIYLISNQKPSSVFKDSEYFGQIRNFNF